MILNVSCEASHVSNHVLKVMCTQISHVMQDVLRSPKQSLALIHFLNVVRHGFWKLKLDKYEFSCLVLVMKLHDLPEDMLKLAYVYRPRMSKSRPIRLSVQTWHFFICRRNVSARCVKYTELKAFK